MNAAQKALNDKIKGMREEVTRLEEQRGLSAIEAVNATNKARELRASAAWLEGNQNSFEVRAWLLEKQSTIELKEAQDQRTAQQAFSTMQNELLGVEDRQNEAVAAVMSSLAYNGAIGINKRTLERQVAKPLAGDGEIDSKGNRYVRFSQGNSATYRAVVMVDGHYGFVLESRGDSE